MKGALQKAACLTALLGCGFLLAAAQTVPYAEGGARLLALGGAGTALSSDSWAHANPAAWADIPSRQAGFYGGQAFGLTELRLGAAHVAWPFGWGTAAVSARSVGFEAFRESHFRLGAARAFGWGTARTFRVGVALTYHHVAFEPPYGAAGTPTLDVGWMVDVAPALTVGGAAGNVTGATLAATSGADLPRTFALGLAFRPGTRTHLLLDAYKPLDADLSVRGGIEVHPLDVFALRAGFSTTPMQFTTGIGVHLGPLTADVYAARHEELGLGWSPGASVNLRF